MYRRRSSRSSPHENSGRLDDGNSVVVVDEATSARALDENVRHRHIWTARDAIGRSRWRCASKSRTIVVRGCSRAATFAWAAATWRKAAAVAVGFSGVRVYPRNQVQDIRLLQNGAWQRFWRAPPRERVEGRGECHGR